MAKKKKKAEVQDVELGTLITWVNEADDATAQSREVSEKCRDYYDSKQLADEEVKTLKARNQAPVVINRIKPKMDGLMGMEKTNRTTAKAFPRTPKHEKDAQAATESIRYVLQDNHYDQKRSSAWDYLLMEGTGGLEIIAEDKAEEVRLTINAIPWDRIIYDPHSRRKDFSDARFLGQVIWMDYDDAAERFSDRAEMLESMLEGSTTYGDKPRWMDSVRRRVKIVELYYHRDGEIKYCCFTRGGFLKEPQVSPYKNEEGETEWPYEFASLFVSREGDRYGATYQYLDIQDEINKRRSKALHLMSVRQVRWEKGAVEDLNKARQELAKPDGVIETTPGMEFEVLKTGDMAAAQFNLLTEAKGEIDAVGYNAAASGKDDRNMSGVALRNRELSGQTEIAPMFDVLKHLDKRVYRKVWNRIRQYWHGEKWIRVTDDEQNLKWVGLNTPMIDPMTGQTVVQNEIAELDVDIVISDAPDAATVQVEEFTAMSEMIKSGFPMPPKAVIMAWPYGNKDQILKMMDEQQQLPEQVKEQMQKMQEEGQKLAQENQQLKADQQNEAAKIQMDAQAKKDELELKAEIQARELQLEKEKVKAQIELERLKAEAQVEIEQMKLQASGEQQQVKNTLDQQKLASDRDMATQKMDFEQKCRAEDEAHKINVEIAPQVTRMLDEGFTKALETLAQAMIQQAEMNRKLIEVLSKPKKVSFVDIRRDDDGYLTGASATVQ